MTWYRICFDKVGSWCFFLSSQALPPNILLKSKLLNESILQNEFSMIPKIRDEVEKLKIM